MGEARRRPAAITRGTRRPAPANWRCPAYPKTLARLRQALRRWLQAQAVKREVEIEITTAVSEACANAIAAAGQARAFSSSSLQDSLSARVSTFDPHSRAALAVARKLWCRQNAALISR